MITDVRDRAVLNKAISALKRGEAIVYPTETSYGLGVDAKNSKALKLVFRIKNRPFSKKVSVMVASKSMAHKFFGKDKKVDALIDAFLPGPLTIITKCKSFRIPNHPFCLSLVKEFGRPITCTSANVSKQGDCYSIKQESQRLDGVSVFIDGGRLRKRRPSTVFDVDRMTVLRKGPISEKSIRKVLDDLV